MFDIGWTEMLVIAIVMIVVVGPKDLPRMLRTFGKTTAKLRSMAGDFQKQFNEALKEAELDEVKKSVDTLRGLNPAAEIKKQLNPFEKAAADVRAGLDSAMKPAPSKAAEPAAGPTAAAAHAAEPLKAGATSIPGVAGPEAMPTSKPVFPAMPDPVPAASAPPEPAKAPAKPAKAVKPASKPAEPKAAAKPAQPKPASAKPAAEKKKKSAGTAS
ncbi:Sec-independent protein translocase protein TatB [Allomesorhizobium camelthorni]|uniref:Sec-independent protein translocase protein TatB n=1 Tax=Allomesorhizobium camelthorni TaxID=475069 RepID=A0A6G4WB83_9HYPH|nr:Sec-independent protein translocase protein TatB [Mesorhizobium camelthorni]NGO51400.1 twin-arginine translocase subunit TatB [Mesorhizobium camelthorni]